LKRYISERQETNEKEAERRTKEAQAELEKVENLLLYANAIDNTAVWESLKNKDEFKESKGTWQQIVFMDFDNRGRDRKIVVQIIGE